jgi:hypothetical protein
MRSPGVCQPQLLQTLTRTASAAPWKARAPSLRTGRKEGMVGAASEAIVATSVTSTGSLSLIYLYQECYMYSFKENKKWQAGLGYGSAFIYCLIQIQHFK